MKRKSKKRIVIRISMGAFVVRVLGLVLVVNLMVIPTAHALTVGNREEKPLQQETFEAMEEVHYMDVYVQEGDNLWKLANEYYQGKRDIRKVIYTIKEINQIGTTIYPGQHLIIPIG